jgi:hypothetical protein
LWSCYERTTAVHNRKTILYLFQVYVIVLN